MLQASMKRKLHIRSFSYSVIILIRLLGSVDYYGQLWQYKYNLLYL